MLSAARVRSGRDLLACTTHCLTAHARFRLGHQQGRLGQVPVSSGHRWLRE